MASTDITLIGLDEATLSDDLVTVLADPSTNGGYKASLGDLSDYVKSELDESELSMELTEVSGNPITITDASNTNCETLIATLSPTQAGSGDPSPTNVRPISGVSTLNVNRTGKNLCLMPTFSSAISWAHQPTNITDLINLVNSLPAGNYTISAKFQLASRNDTSDYSTYGFAFWGLTTNAIASWGTSSAGATKKVTISFAKTDSTTCSNIYFYGCGNDTVGPTGTAILKEFQIELSSSKNIVPFVDNVVSSSQNLTITTTSDGGIHISGSPMGGYAGLTSTITTYIPSGTTITLSRSVARNYRMYAHLTYADASTFDFIVHIGETSNTLTLNKDVSSIKLYLSIMNESTNYDETIYPQLEFGSSATPYEPYQGATPYEPYQGRTYRVEIGQKNKLPMTVDGIKSANTSGSWSGNVYTINGMTFTIQTDIRNNVVGIRCNGQATDNVFFLVYDGTTTVSSGAKFNLSASKNDGNFDTHVANGSSNIAHVVGTSAQTGEDTLSDTTFTQVVFFFNSRYNDDVTLYPMIRTKIDDSEFAPYNPNLADTIYGGSVDLNTGVLTVDKAIVDLGDFTWHYIQADNVFYNVMPTTCDYNAGSIDTLCSGFAYDTDATWTPYLGENQYMMCKDLYSLNRVSIAVKNTSVSTAEDFKTLVTGMKFVYPLATPTTTQLTPQTLRLLQGNNTLWTNGESLEVEYQPNNFVGQLKAWILDQLG